MTGIGITVVGGAILTLASCTDASRPLLTEPEWALPPASFLVASTNNSYTLNADFDQGTMINVNHDVPNQLQLSQFSAPLPFVNIAASGRGTAIRINVNDGAIIGEYRTAPDFRGRDPSRTTVDQLGNVWVSNRAEAEGGRGSVARIGVLVGGTRSNADGTANPLGEYLKPPFSYNTCVDRDADGMIRTSRGLGDILPWTNAGGADNQGGVSTAADECIINYTRIVGANARTVAVDASNDVWTGGADNDHEKISGISGLPVPGTQFNRGCGGYGGLIDKNGVLWSARFGANLLRYDPATATSTCLNTSYGDYGLGLDPVTGEIWHTYLGGGSVVKISPSAVILGVFPHGFYYAQGVAVDGAGNVWVAHSLFGATTVGHLRTDGTFVGNVVLPGGNGPTGVAVDANGKVWVANINTNNAMRIDPSAGPIGGGGFPIGAVDLTVNLGSGASPYNYSDMTGSVALGGTVSQGTWSIVQDAGVAGAEWGSVSWNTEPEGTVPAGGSIVVEARTSDTEAGLSGVAFTPVGNGVAFSMMGRYIEVRATLRAAPDGTSPVLSDLRIQAAQDLIAPFCALTKVATNASGQKYIEVTTRDIESGLQSIEVTKAVNLTAPVPAFAPGTTADVVVTATKVDPTKSSTLALRVTDVAGNVTNCDPTDVTVHRSTGAPVATWLTDIPTAERWVEVHNGTPGVTSLHVTVNGKKFLVAGLGDGQQRTIDIGSAMRPGDANTISLVPAGRPGSSTWVLIRD